MKPKEFAPLQFLSASPHPWDPGTVVCAALELDGFAEDDVESMLVEVQGNLRIPIVITGGILGSGFAEGPVSVSNPADLCVPISGRLFARMDQEHDGKLKLTFTIVSDWGDKVAKTVQVEKFVRYTGANRFGVRDSSYGGTAGSSPTSSSGWRPSPRSGIELRLRSGSSGTT